MTMTRTMRATLGLLTLAAIAAGPATRPTTQALTDRDSVEYFATQRPLKFRVPKTWQPTENLARGGGVSFPFRLAGPAPKSSTSSRAIAPQLRVGVYWPCEKQAQFDELTKDRRQRMLTHQPAAELIEDGAIEVSGAPAWRLRWRYDVAPAGTRNGDKPKRPAKPTTVIEQTILISRFYAVAEITLSSEAATFERFLPSAEAVAASVEPVKN